MLYTAIKILFSASMVISVTLLAERASTRFAGVVLGFPLGVGLSLFFIGYEQGAAYAAQSAAWSLPGLLAILAFCRGYLLGSRLLPGSSVLTITAALLSGLACFFAVSVLLFALLPQSLWFKLAFTLTGLALTAWQFQHLAPGKVPRRVPLTPWLLFSRAGWAAAFIVLITALAQTVGPRWSGLFAAFPTTVLPSAIILHYHHGADSIAALFRELPQGMLAIVLFCLAVSASYPRYGIYGGTILSYGVATLYLLLYEWKLRGLVRRNLSTG